MAVQLRDTLFGHMIHSLSRGSLLRYADEHENQVALNSTLSPLDTSGDSPRIRVNDLPSHTAPDPHRNPEQDAETKSHEKLSQFIHLVDWYGADDLEVDVIRMRRREQSLADRDSRIHTTGPPNGKSM